MVALAQRLTRILRQADRIWVAVIAIAVTPDADGAGARGRQRPRPRCNHSRAPIAESGPGFVVSTSAQGDACAMDADD